MDDDLDFSNDQFLRQLQNYSTQMTNHMEKCKKGLVDTVDQISYIEQKREIEKNAIEQEFEKISIQIQYLLEKRARYLLKSLDSQIDIKTQELLKRVHLYQNMILSADDLQQEMRKLERFELNNNEHIIQSHESFARNTKNNNYMPSTVMKIPHNLKGFNSIDHPNKIKNVPNMDPPPIPVHVVMPQNQNKQFFSVPLSSASNESIIDTGNINEQLRNPSQFSKKRLLSEVHKFLLDKPPVAYKPSVLFTFNNSRFIKDIEYRMNHFGYLNISTGSSMKDIQNSFNYGLNWAWNKTNPIINLTSMIFHKKKKNVQELQTIPPPLLMIYLGIEKALAEDFVETFTIITCNNKLLPVGCIIPVLDYNNNEEIDAWLDPSQISATKIKNNAKNNVIDNNFENDYAYDADLFSDEDLHGNNFRSVLRVCVLIYDSSIDYFQIDEQIDIWKNRYHLRSILGVEMKGVSKSKQIVCTSECPKCYVGCIFYDKEGIVQGQDSIFDSIANTVFSPTSDADGNHSEEDQQLLMQD